MLYEKIVKKDDANIHAKNIGDLIRQFDIELDEFLIEKLDSFPANDKYDIIYDAHYVIELKNNTILVFSGVVDVPDSPTYTVLVDLKHYHLYYIGSSSVGNSVHEYDLSGSLLVEKDYGLNKIDIDEFIRNHFIEYPCDSIDDILSNLDIDIELSSNLRQHKIDYGSFKVLFNEYFIQEHDGVEYYVFSGVLDSIVFDLEPPIIYLDPVNQLLYVQEFSMRVLSVTLYDSNDDKIDSYEPDLDYFSEINIAKALKSKKSSLLY